MNMNFLIATAESPVSLVSLLMIIGCCLALGGVILYFARQKGESTDETKRATALRSVALTVVLISAIVTGIGWSWPVAIGLMLACCALEGN